MTQPSARPRVWAGMMKLTLLIFAVSALAGPTSAQGLVATSNVGAVLAAGQAVHPQPDLWERRVLAMAAFKNPLSRPVLSVVPAVMPENLATAERTQIQAKDVWFADEGLRLSGARLAYTTRF